jgi:two-component system response regulator
MGISCLLSHNPVRLKLDFSRQFRSEFSQVTLAMIVLLHIEDNDDDTFMLAEAFKREGIPHRFQRAVNGAEGLNYLLGVDQYGDRTAYPFPDLVITDFSMPVLDGLGFLRSLRETSLSGSLATMALTSSKCDADIEAAYQLGVLACFAKPSDLTEWRALAIQAYGVYGRFRQMLPSPLGQNADVLPS